MFSAHIDDDFFWKDPTYIELPTIVLSLNFSKNTQL